MNIHTCLVTFNRLELTQQAIASYLENTDGPWSLVIVDNNSDDGTREWLMEFTHGWSSRRQTILLDENRYPGFATNRGWELAPPDADVLHRADNDFVFLSGWNHHVALTLTANPRLGQLGLRTDEEELHNTHNVGGNCVIRRELWDQGLRYDERPWPQIAKKVPGYTEDSFLSPAVVKLGWEWGRVTVPCIRPISSEDPDDEYYIRTWTDRGMR